MIVSKKILYYPLFFIFFVSSVTALGPYFSQYNPYWLVMLLFMAALLCAISIMQILVATFFPISILGTFFFLVFYLAGLYSKNGQELRLAMPMFTHLCCFLLSVWFFDRLSKNKNIFYTVLLSFFVAASANFF
jgi:hypothetical protein